METVVIQDWRGLEQYVPAWEDLAAGAVEPNVFYEHWMLIPAMRTLADKSDLRIVLFFASDPVHRTTPGILCGLFPLRLHHDLYKLPVRNYTTWKHKYCFLCTPLVRRSYEQEVLASFFAWLGNHRGRPAIMQFKHISGEGPFHRALIDAVNASGRASYVWETFNRALFKPRVSSEDYIAEAISGRRRKEFRRLQRLLTEKGTLTFSTADSEVNLFKFINDFLKLEASGWKGKARTAFASDKSDRAFFEAITAEAFSRNRLMLLSMNLSDKPIAMKCNLLAGEGSFAFKIGYDERFNQYSPGVLLELENIRALHERPHIQWMDSCAEPAHFMINHLWIDRRTIRTVIVSTERLYGDFAVLILFLMNWLRMTFFKGLFKGVGKKTARGGARPERRELPSESISTNGAGDGNS